MSSALAALAAQGGTISPYQRDRPFVNAALFLGKGRQREIMKLADRLIEFEITDSDFKPDMVKFVLRNDDLFFFKNDELGLYKDIIFSWGYPKISAPARIMKIRRVKGGGKGAAGRGRSGDVEVRRDFNTFEIHGQGKEVSFNNRHSRTVHRGKKASQIVREMALRLGIPRNALVIQETNTILEEQTQGTESDHDFLVRLAAAEGFQWYVDDDGFFFGERDFSKPVSHLFTWRDDPFGRLMGVEIDQDVRAPVGQAVASGYDRNKKRCFVATESHTKSADGSTTTANSNAVLTVNQLVEGQLPDKLLVGSIEELTAVEREQRAFLEAAQDTLTQANLAEEALRGERDFALDRIKDLGSMSQGDDAEKFAETVLENPDNFIAFQGGVAEAMREALVEYEAANTAHQNASAQAAAIAKETDKAKAKFGELEKLIVSKRDAGQAEDSEHLGKASGTSVQKIKRQARRNFRKANQSVVKITLTVVGDPTIKAKQNIEVRNIGQRLDGVYYAKEVKHRITPESYTTEIKLIGQSTPEGVKQIEKKKKPVEVAKNVQGQVGVYLITKKGGELTSGSQRIFYVDNEGREVEFRDLEKRSASDLKAMREAVVNDDTAFASEGARERLLRDIDLATTRRIAATIDAKRKAEMAAKVKAKDEEKRKGGPGAGAENLPSPIRPKI